ncbi:hypothetical protein CLV30_12845 [Haloactinopolyspora alba]|uniref:Uncharacterized protein n=1 Tax=Haloactinopolyspora alba TaxID=648780 RepID=A0A2P8DEZ7_9ACTN|nr:hypothetical protein [Haloactinopolyspora alba]PSK95793.1 hypothetical protein CLV30_12845 [Haloactinopolyspora alba]
MLLTVVILGIAVIVWLLHLMQRDMSELVYALLDVHPDDGDDGWPDDPDDDAPDGHHIRPLDPANVDLHTATERTLRYAEHARPGVRT